MNSSKILGRHPDFPGSEVGFDSDLNLYRTIPYPSEADLERFYTKEYRDIRQESPDHSYVSFMRHRAVKQSQFILDASKRDQFRSMLDIGCGCGELLNAFDHCTKKLVGYETDTMMASHAKTKRTSDSIEIRNQHFTPGEDPDLFDLITMSHVLEHVPDPSDFLARLRTESLSPGGVMFLEVPNEPITWVEKQIEWRRVGLGHVNYFTEKSLGNILVKAGFEKLVFRECGKLVRHHMASCRPKSSILAKIGRRIRKIVPARPTLPDYDTQGGSHPRIYLQVIAFNPTN